MQEVTEYALAILRVLRGVQNVTVPELVDVLAGGNRRLRMRHQQREESLVGDRHFFGVLARPALAFLDIHQLELNGIEIQRFDGSYDLLHWPAVANVHDGLPLFVCDNRVMRSRVQFRNALSHGLTLQARIAAEHRSVPCTASRTP